MLCALQSDTVLSKAIEVQIDNAAGRIGGVNFEKDGLGILGKSVSQRESRNDCGLSALYRVSKETGGTDRESADCCEREALSFGHLWTDL